MIEVKARCNGCGKVARFAVTEPLPCEPGDEFFFPAPHHGCGSERGLMTWQKPFTLDGDDRRVDAEDWPEYLPG